ncbi:AraC family transcriptional regulator [Amycolatopsis suaedae]|uniref:AraC family transcriptional regulator n=1 Tax=Amycolatopsis suaedae TaxID=2510978 RepID=A0A4Q7J5C0_9PSEU|nr:GyrI-like domain-containing protein [Amycolatopsis suaedae]RZQ61936.1 AraC family transcriptional regulator [Amycolatopsis suaedae]
MPAGRYLRVRTEGPLPYAIVDGWATIWAAEDRGELDRAYATDFEVWPAGRQPEIYVSLRPAR